MTVLVVLVTFVVMEPLTYAAHRWVMHGQRGMAWHQSHHSAETGGWERNDWYPVVFAATGMLAAVAGATLGSLEWLLPTSIGAALYGLAYGFVHDVYIHRRVPRFTAELGWCERLKAAHRIHHLWGGEPFGMLVPVVPAALRRRAAVVAYDPFPSSGQRATGRASGSIPSHVPVEP
ncbi:MAG: hypothetical protein AVDCRST_MAG20-2011 [uncultured Acidimicrobiales bacterium]|uniref:Fatty acid hydroxylase domain-containing protein n=1 Tax=uncultured Acidimicrobiales bacterium TaxID=310071 RepID=A0A6J4I9Y7_9ACTN|nr:MAG: hypothetical protein AVDCRST_MAG20-2011 [uncultured Acidimicrobiales bacterium]